MAACGEGCTALMRSHLIALVAAWVPSAQGPRLKGRAKERGAPAKTTLDERASEGTKQRVPKG